MTARTRTQRDHGGGLDGAIARFGGHRAAWEDLSTGINPRPYPIPDLPADAWTALPDQGAMDALEAAARDFWMVPAGAAVLAAPGASSLIAKIPSLLPTGTVRIVERTYNEHEAAFRAHGWSVVRGEEGERADARVVVHPNNPTGFMWSGADEAPGRRLLVVDESFCDISLGNTHVRSIATEPGVLILKSLGKFWGLRDCAWALSSVIQRWWRNCATRLGLGPSLAPRSRLGARRLKTWTGPIARANGCTSMWRGWMR